MCARAARNGRQARRRVQRSLACRSVARQGIQPPPKPTPRGASSRGDARFVLVIGLESARGRSRWRGRRAESRADGQVDVPAQALARAITPQRLKAHLVALAAVAGRSGGTRAVGTLGYSDSVGYVTRQLRAVGYRPKLKTFSFDYFRETKPTVFERVSPGLRRYESGKDFLTIRYSGGGDVTAQVVPVDFGATSSGCEASDFAGFPAGAVALMRRGGCRNSDKAAAAQSGGAAAALIANDGRRAHRPLMATLFGPGTRIPVLIVSAEVGSARGVGTASPVQGGSTSRSPGRGRGPRTIADLPGRKSVVLLGAHLDSVASGPGINDNGSGSALVLEVARQARRLHLRPKHGLRFAFWGGEEIGLIGSTSYAQSLSAKQRRGILDVLNFDMVGSPNFGRIVYSGEGEPPGSLRIENAFRAYFAARRLPVDEASLNGSPTTRRSRRPASRSGAIHRRRRGEDGRVGPALRGSANHRSTRAATRPATRSRIATAAFSSRWPTQARWWRCASPARRREYRCATLRGRSALQPRTAARRSMPEPTCRCGRARRGRTPRLRSERDG